jgi:hypothetical protein
MEFFVDWRTMRRKQDAVDEEAMLESIAAAVGLAPSRLWTRRLLRVFPIRPNTCFRELRLGLAGGCGLAAVPNVAVAIAAAGLRVRVRVRVRVKVSVELGARS